MSNRVLGEWSEMHPVAIARNVLIFAGIAGGAFFAISAARGGVTDESGTDEPAVSSPIVLNTAKPVDLGKAPLSEPLSLEKGFGRSELTGEQVVRVPESPLEELSFDRRWDISLALTPPKPPTDLPPDKATDEVGEPEPEDVVENDEFHLAHLPNEARKIAEDAADDYRTGTSLLKAGLKESRLPGQEGKAGFEKMASAADLLTDARDKVTKALDYAPNDASLLSLMQKIKANLFVCKKYGR